jgi:hypothetical protein
VISRDEMKRKVSNIFTEKWKWNEYMKKWILQNANENGFFLGGNRKKYGTMFSSRTNLKTEFPF